MKYDPIRSSLEVLERTPKTLHALLNGLSDEWVMQDEGPGTWSAFDVLAHLVFCEKWNFFSRIAFIRSASGVKKLPVFDTGNQFALAEGKNISALLAEFANQRERNLTALREDPLCEADLSRTAIHPKIGEVSLRNVLCAWVAHDLAHTAQVARVMAKQYKQEVGPFTEFLHILN